MIEHSGIGRYIQSLLPWLPRFGAEVVAWMSPEQVRDPRWDFPGVTRQGVTAKIFSIQEQVRIAQAAHAARVDLLHVPHLNAPLGVRLPLVVTIHDLIPFHYPEAITARFGGMYFQAMARLAPYRARRVLTVSEHTRSDLIRLVGADPAKITAIPLGVGMEFAQPADAASRRAVRERFGLKGRYLLYAGQWKGYKNIGLLLDVMERLDPETFGDVRLVLVGKEDPRVPLRSELERRGIAERVVVTGFVADSDLIALYQEATAFVFPSRYEGFGLPPLEAMAAGVPVLTSNCASIPEVVGPAGVLLGPDSVLEWQQAIESICSDPQRRNALADAGRARAQSFQWERVGERTVDAYRQVLGRS
ncbi:MAG TPA: glycosyltransferase family 1 protein [Stenomitos sp.]